MPASAATPATCGVCALSAPTVHCDACAMWMCGEGRCDEEVHSAAALRSHVRTPLLAAATSSSAVVAASSPSAPKLPSPPPAVASPSLPSAPAGALCDLCDSDLAVLECLECDQLLCAECSAALHRPAKMRTHDVRSIGAAAAAASSAVASSVPAPATTSLQSNASTKALASPSLAPPSSPALTKSATAPPAATPTAAAAVKSSASSVSLAAAPPFECELCEIDRSEVWCAACDSAYCPSCDGEVHRPAKNAAHKREPIAATPAAAATKPVAPPPTPAAAVAVPSKPPAATPAASSASSATVAAASSVVAAVAASPAAPSSSSALSITLSRTCSLCEEAPASSHCIQCAQFLCAECAVELHRPARMAGHDLENLVQDSESMIPVATPKSAAGAAPVAAPIVAAPADSTPKDAATSVAASSSEVSAKQPAALSKPSPAAAAKSKDADQKPLTPTNVPTKQSKPAVEPATSSVKLGGAPTKTDSSTTTSSKRSTLTASPCAPSVPALPLPRDERVEESKEPLQDQRTPKAAKSSRSITSPRQSSPKAAASRLEQLEELIAQQLSSRDAATPAPEEEEAALTARAERPRSAKKHQRGPSRGQQKQKPKQEQPAQSVSDNRFDGPETAEERAERDALAVQRERKAKRLRAEALHRDQAHQSALQSLLRVQHRQAAAEVERTKAARRALRDSQRLGGPGRVVSHETERFRAAQAEEKQQHQQQDDSAAGPSFLPRRRSLSPSDLDFIPRGARPLPRRGLRAFEDADEPSLEAELLAEEHDHPLPPRGPSARSRAGRTSRAQRSRDRILMVGALSDQANYVTINSHPLPPAHGAHSAPLPPPPSLPQPHSIRRRRGDRESDVYRLDQADLDLGVAELLALFRRQANQAVAGGHGSWAHGHEGPSSHRAIRPPLPREPHPFAFDLSSEEDEGEDEDEAEWKEERSGAMSARVGPAGLFAMERIQPYGFFAGIEREESMWQQRSALLPPPPPPPHPPRPSSASLGGGRTARAARASASTSLHSYVPPHASPSKPLPFYSVPLREVTPSDRLVQEVASSAVPGRWRSKNIRTVFGLAGVRKVQAVARSTLEEPNNPYLQ